MTAQIRILDASDAEELFRLRRESLLESPASFLSSPEDDGMLASIDGLRNRLQRGPDSVVFGAFADRLVGMLGLYRDFHAKTAHKVNVWGAFVAPEWRCQGLGKRLLEAVIAHARTLEGVTSVQLGVSQSAATARRLYERVGFETWGVEPDAIRFDGRSELEYHMRLPLI